MVAVSLGKRGVQGFRYGGSMDFVAVGGMLVTLNIGLVASDERDLFDVFSCAHVTKFE